MLSLYTAVLVFALVKGVLSQSGPWGQCGGIGWTGSTTCTSGWTCVFSNDWYSQCLASTSSSSIATSASHSTSASSSSAPAHSTSASSSASSASSTPSLTGIAASAPTIGPSLLTGKLPALGWNSWNAYGCDINETKVLDAAELIVSLGLYKAGYQYVNIDDCWPLMARNTTTNRIVPDPTKFPNGISGVATKVHALGLKFGIYSDAGTTTCAGFPGSLGNEATDAATFSEWGVDYLKYDNCAVPANWSDSSTPQNNDWYNSNSAIRYRQMGAALAGQTQPIQFSVCIWGNADVFEWGARVGHSWRISGDVSAVWSSITSIISTNVANLGSINFFGHNDMDMMEIGNGALTIQEQRSHFAAWVFLKSPILLGTDLSLLASDQVAIISNAELLAFHQDATIGTPAMPFTPSSGAVTTDPPEYYSGASSKGTHVFILNTASATATKSFNFANVPGLSGNGTGSYVVHDMWAGVDIGTFQGSYTTSLASHDNAALFIKPA
ncbi:glycoside hydrolase superfamily [Cytidiella melzeri]|nr:glycoside hydrolase superfamily [Cytidiella melzeri]